MSPLAKLLDYLAWKYKVLFIVSAGNHSAEFTLAEADLATVEARERVVLKGLGDTHRNRRLLAPAEAMNALTVGAVDQDGAGTWTPLVSGERSLLETPGLPATYSALGRGYGRSIKPDILAPGGREVFVPEPRQAENGPVVYKPNLGRSALHPPGHRVAAPSETRGRRDGTRFSYGTSNAAALTTRLAARIAEAVLDLQAETGREDLAAVPLALLVKALLVHTAEWPEAAFKALEGALRNERNNNTFADEVTAFLGYGVLRQDRADACAPYRATLVGGGALQVGEALEHRIPLPACLHGHAAWRRLTTTLAWFTPTQPGRRKYRCASLDWTVPKAKNLSPLRVKREQVHGLAVGRGTVRHDVLEASSGAINLPEGQLFLPIRVSCFEDAPCPPEPIHYAVAISLEVAPEVALPIYDEVRSIVRPLVPVAAGRPPAPGR